MEKEAMLRVSLMSWYRREPERLVSYQNVLPDKNTIRWEIQNNVWRDLFFLLNWNSEFSSSVCRLEDGPTLETSALWVGQFTLSVQLIKLNSLFLTPPHRRSTTVSYPLNSLRLFAYLPPLLKKLYTIFLYFLDLSSNMYQIGSATLPCTEQQERTISPLCWPFLKGVQMSMSRDILERLLYA